MADQDIPFSGGGEGHEMRLNAKGTVGSFRSASVCVCIYIYIYNQKLSKFLSGVFTHNYFLI